MSNWSDQDRQMRSITLICLFTLVSLMLIFGSLTVLLAENPGTAGTAWKAVLYTLPFWAITLFCWALFLSSSRRRLVRIRKAEKSL